MSSAPVILHILLFVGYFDNVCSQQPQIVEEIFTAVKRKGDTGYLNCTVSRQGDNKVQWIQPEDGPNDNLISSNTEIRVLNQIIKGKYKYEVIKQVRPNDKTTYMLVVNHLREEDSGRYICVIFLRGKPRSTWPQRYGNLTVQVPPTIIVSQTTNTVQREQGQDITLTCNASGNPVPNITWIRADGFTLPDGRLSHRGHNLTIRNIKKDDRGTYRCVADNNVVPPGQHDAKLIVYYKPESEAVQDTVGQAQNRRFHAILECRIRGMPEPNLTWYMETARGEVKLSDNEKYDLNQLLTHGSSLQIGEVWYSLRILNVQANDYSVYYCEGKNAYGASRASIRLYETNECQGGDCPSISNEVPGRVNITSDVQSLLFDEYTLTWDEPETHGWEILAYHLRLLTIDRNMSTKISTKGHVRSYTFMGLTPGTTYNISIEAENVYGRSPIAVITATTHLTFTKNGCIGGQCSSNTVRNQHPASVISIIMSLISVLILSNRID